MDHKCKQQEKIKIAACPPSATPYSPQGPTPICSTPTSNAPLTTPTSFCPSFMDPDARIHSSYSASLASHCSRAKYRAEKQSLKAQAKITKRETHALAKEAKHQAKEFKREAKRQAKELKREVRHQAKECNREIKHQAREFKKEVHH